MTAAVSAPGVPAKLLAHATTLTALSTIAAHPQPMSTTPGAQGLNYGNRCGSPHQTTVSSCHQNPAGSSATYDWRAQQIGHRMAAGADLKETMTNRPAQLLRCCQSLSRRQSPAPFCQETRLLSLHLPALCSFGHEWHWFWQPRDN